MGRYRGCCDHGLPSDVHRRLTEVRGDQYEEHELFPAQTERRTKQMVQLFRRIPPTKGLFRDWGK